MAEVQQEPVYLTYGNDAQIEQNDFLNAVSNNMESYLSQQPWSNKRKDLFRAAYQDIMSRGVTGASNATGIWNVHHNGNQIDLDSLSRKEREMYGEAAYFIQQQMSTLPTKQAKEEEAKAKLASLPVFNNGYITQQFQGYIGNNMFGGRDWDRNTDWNTLDEADENGIRGITNRASKLADMLEGYAASLKEGEHNFEGSPFKDLNDFKSKVALAVAALRSSDPNDDKDALNRIGLNINDYLSTGADELVQVGDRQMTRAEAAEALQQIEQQEQQQQPQEQSTQEQQQQQEPDNSYFSKIARSKKGQNTPISALVSKYTNDEGLISGLNEMASKMKLSTEDWNDLNGALSFYNQNGRLSNLSSEEIAMFRKLPGYQNLAPDTLKKLPGVEGFYFDTRTNQAIQAFTPQMLSALGEQAGGGNDLLGSQSQQAKQKEYLNRPAEAFSGFTDAEWAELASIGADIVSIVDPEPITAAAAGVGAAGLRHYARSQEPEDWGLMDYLGQAADYVTGAIGAVPLAGDAVLVAKTVRNLRRLGRLGAWNDILSNSSQVKDIWNNKIMGDESMTAGDWKALAQFFRGVLGHGKLNQSNLAQRAVLKHRGVQVTQPADVKGIKAKTRAWAEKTGFAAPKEIKQTRGKTKVDTIKVKMDGKETEVELTTKTKAELEEALKGKDQAGRDDIVRELSEVKAKAKEQKVDLEKVKATAPRGRSGRYLRRFTGRSIEGDRTFGEKLKESSPIKRTGTDDFENWLQTRGVWSKVGYGNNRLLRAIDRQFQTGSIYKINEQAVASSKSSEQKQLSAPKQPLRLPSPSDVHVGPRRDITPVGNRPKSLLSVRESQREMFNWMDSYGLGLHGNGSKRGPSTIKGGYNSGKDVAPGTYTASIKDTNGREHNIVFSRSADGKQIEVKFDEKSKIHNSLDNARRYLNQQLYDLQKSKKINYTDLGRLLNAYKKQGILKQGGIIINK